MDIAFIMGMIFGFIVGFFFSKFIFKQVAHEVYKMLKEKNELPDDDNSNWWKPKGWRPG